MSKVSSLCLNISYLPSYKQFPNLRPICRSFSAGWQRIASKKWTLKKYNYYENRKNELFTIGIYRFHGGREKWILNSPVPSELPMITKHLEAKFFIHASSDQISYACIRPVSHGGKQKYCLIVSSCYWYWNGISSVGMGSPGPMQKLMCRSINSVNW